MLSSHTFLFSIQWCGYPNTCAPKNVMDNNNSNEYPEIQIFEFGAKKHQLRAQTLYQYSHVLNHILLSTLTRYTKPLQNSLSRVSHSLASSSGPSPSFSWMSNIACKLFNREIGRGATQRVFKTRNIYSSVPERLSLPISSFIGIGFWSVVWSVMQV